MVKSTPIRIWLVLAAAFMMVLTGAAQTTVSANEAQRSAAGQATARQAAYPAKFSWHDEEIGTTAGQTGGDPGGNPRHDCRPRIPRIHAKIRGIRGQVFSVFSVQNSVAHRSPGQDAESAFWIDAV